MMLTLRGVSYAHSNKELLLSNINFTVNNRQKIALVGNNGSGKSTLLKIMAGLLPVMEGHINCRSLPYYVPQHYGQFNGTTIAEALGIDRQLKALKEILSGKVTADNLNLINDDWTLEQRCYEAMMQWDLGNLDLDQKVNSLSGGQKTKVFLAGVIIHRPELVLLDEPSNNLDTEGRNLLYSYIRNSPQSMVVVSHDRALLNLLDPIAEFDKKGITFYGGSYDFYEEQKQFEQITLESDIHEKERLLRKAKDTAQNTRERKQKLDARGKQKQIKSGLPTIMMNTFKNKAEKSSARMKEVHAEKTNQLFDDLEHLKKELPDTDTFKLDFDNPQIPPGKVLIDCSDLNVSFRSDLLWKFPVSFKIMSGGRMAIKGKNGAGKTTLIKLMRGELSADVGKITRTRFTSIYLDQEYSLITNTLSVYEQAQKFNSGGLVEHEIKIRLVRFLFTGNYWNKPCSTLSGGEKMRLALCCMNIALKAPDLILLDEPTNNLDLHNIRILVAAINSYNGAVLVISHDEQFLNEIHVSDFIKLE